MAFQIVKNYPIHDDRDCIVGWRGCALPNAYETLACAQKIACRISDECWGEIPVKIVPFGESSFGPSFPLCTKLLDDIEF